MLSIRYRSVALKLLLAGLLVVLVASYSADAAPTGKLLANSKAPVPAKAGTPAKPKIPANPKAPAKVVPQSNVKSTPSVKGSSKGPATGKQVG